MRTGRTTHGNEGYPQPRLLSKLTLKKCDDYSQTGLKNTILEKRQKAAKNGTNNNIRDAIANLYKGDAVS